MEKAVGYVRVSTDEQNLEGQIAQIKKYCELNNYELLEIVEEKGVSGSTSINNRPAGSTLQGFITQGATAIIAVKLDRMFRATVDALTQTDAWSKQGVGLHIIDFCGFGALNTISPLGRMVFTMQAAFAEMELAQIRSRTKAAMQHKISRGLSAGQTPFGYYREGFKVIEYSWRNEAIIFIKKLVALKHSSRFIASCVSEQFKTPISHTTIIRMQERGELA